MGHEYALYDQVDTRGLLSCRFSGTMSKESGVALMAEVEEIEALFPEGFKRFSDLSSLRTLNLSTSEIREIATLRERAYRGPKVQSAIFSPDPYTYGVMRIYSAVMFPTPITVEVFYKLSDAAAWLELPEEHLLLAEK